MYKKYDCIIFTDKPDPRTVWKTLGAYAIANVLRKQGYSCLVIDHFHGFNTKDIEFILEHTVSEQTKFVGFSVGFFASTEGKSPLDITADKSFFGAMNINQSFCPQGKSFEDFLISKLRILNSNCKIVIGGPQAISHQVSNKNIDYLVIGYAEVSIVNLMKFLDSGAEIDHSYKNIHGITLIDDRNADSYSFAKCTMNWLPEDVGNSRVLPLEISRGCIFNCSFCQYPLRGKKLNDHIRGADSIYQELQDNYDRYGITTYTLIDDTFNDNDEKLDNFLAAVKRLTFQPMFWCYARSDLFISKPDRLAKLYDIGVRAMFFGIETLHRQAGLTVGKGMHAHRQIELVQNIRSKYGNDLMMHGNLIIGLPHEPIEHVYKTYELFTSGEFPLHTVKFNSLKINKHASWWQSDFDKNYKKYGYEEVDPVLHPPKKVLSQGYTLGSDFLNWKNDLTTFELALKAEKELNQAAWDSGVMHIEGQILWSMLNYKMFSFDQLKNLKTTDIDYAVLSKEKIKTVIEYKRYLYKLLTTPEVQTIIHDKE